MPPADDVLASPHPSAEVLAAFLDGRLTAAEMDALEPHVAACESCCAFLRGLPNNPMSLMLRETVAGPAAALQSDADPAAALAGHPRYHLLEPLGSGGMGTVYKARHSLMDRLVALKVIHRRLLRHPAAVERFRREAKAAAKLAHPNIVTAHDADQAGGCHFLVMEFIEGRSLAAVVADRGPLGVAEACAYARQAALGLQHAFEHGMVHRDVKPQNLMLTPQGQVKVLDFGLAHVGGDEPDAGPATPADTVVSAPAAALTRASSMLGTPDYMAPEQSADARAVDIRTDIYALGCTLYFLLTGRPPFPEGMPADKLAAHRERSPPPLAAVPHGLARLVDRMLAKNPADRYPTPAAVAAALRPFAEPPSRRRYALLATGIAVLSLLASAFYAIAGEGMLILEVQEPGATVTIDGRDVAIQFPRGEIGLRPGRHTLQVTKDGFTAHTEEFELRRGGRLERTARLLKIWPADTLSHERLSAAARAVAEDGGVAQVPAELVAVFGDGRLTHWGPVNCVALSRDGTVMASGGADHLVRVWDAATGERRHVLTGHTREVLAVAFSPGGDVLASGSADGFVRLWDPATGRLRHICWGSSVHSVAFTSDGRVLYAAHNNGYVVRWDVATGQELLPYIRVAHSDAEVAAHAAAASGVSSAALRLSGHDGEVTAAALAPDDRALASGGRDHAVKLWDAATGQSRGTLGRHGGQVAALAFGPEPRSLASASWYGDVKLWDVLAGKERKTFDGRLSARSVAIDPSGRTVASGDYVGRINLWDATAGDSPGLLLDRHGSDVRGLAFGPGGTTLAAATWDGGVRLWDVAARADRTPVAGPWGMLNAVAVSPDGRSVAAACQGGTVHLWDVTTGAGTIVFQDPVYATGVAFSPDGRTLAAAYALDIRLWDVDAGRPGRTLKTPLGVRAVAFSRDGRTLAAVGSSAGRLWLWDTASWELRQPPAERPDVRLWSVAFSPDGTALAAGGDGGTISVWDVAPGPAPPTRRWAVPPWQPGTTSVRGLAFSPDGTTLAATGHGPNAVTLWDPATGRSRPTEARMEHTREALGVAFSPDGTGLASVGMDGTMRLWDPTTGLPRRAVSLGPSRRDVLGVVFSPDGRHVVTANGNGTAYLLRLALLE